MGLHFSNSKVKSDRKEETTLGARIGWADGVKTAYAQIEGYARAYENSTTSVGRYHGKPTIAAGFDYNHEDKYTFSLTGLYGGYSSDVTTGASRIETDYTDYGAGFSAVNRTFKNAKRELFYGASVNWSQKNKKAGAFGATKGELQYNKFDLPFIVGLELTARDWLIFRASATQNFVLGETENNETFAANPQGINTIRNNTTVAAGVGFKYDELTIDGTLSAATTGANAGVISGSSLLANASATYVF